MPYYEDQLDELNESLLNIMDKLSEQGVEEEAMYAAMLPSAFIALTAMEVLLDED